MLHIAAPPPHCICDNFSQWMAPEVCAGSGELGTVATTASDVYMLGGLAYELLTSGVPPFHWLMTMPSLLRARRCQAGPVRIPGVPGAVPGLLGKSTLEAAAEYGVDIPWRVRVDGVPDGRGRLALLQGLLTECLASEPGARPRLPALFATLAGLRVEGDSEHPAAGLYC